MKSVLGVSRVLERLVEALPKSVHLVVKEGYRDVPITHVKPGVLILVKPSEKIPWMGSLSKVPRLLMNP